MIALIVDTMYMLAFTVLIIAIGIHVLKKALDYL